MGEKLTDEQVKEMESRAQKVAALRENLRSGRNRPPDEPGQAASGTSEAPGRVEPNDAPAVGATFQDARGKAKRLTPTGGSPLASDRRTGDNGRSPKGEPERSGRGNRRPEKSGGGASVNTAATERPEPAGASQQHPAVGRLEASEIIAEPSLEPDRPQAAFEGQSNGPLSRFKEDYRRTQREGQNVYCLITNPAQFITGDEFKQLKSREASETSTNSASFNSGNSEKPAFFKGGVLSKQEAEELYEPLVAALSDGFGYADQGLWKLCPQLDERPIWSNTTPREDQTLAKLLLKRGQKSPAAALIVRETVNSADYILVGMMFGPRMIETAQALRERPRAPSKKVTLFRKAQA